MCDRWLSSSSPSVNLQPSAPPPHGTGACILDVFTFDALFAGTDSRIFVSALDHRGACSAEIELTESNLHTCTKSVAIVRRDLFERNRVDSFNVVFSGIDGDPVAVRVRSDCSGSLDGWLLEKIQVTPVGHCILEFCCEQWIDRHMSERELQVLPFIGCFVRDDSHPASAMQPAVSSCGSTATSSRVILPPSFGSSQPPVLAYGSLPSGSVYGAPPPEHSFAYDAAPPVHCAAFPSPTQASSSLHSVASTPVHPLSPPRAYSKAEMIRIVENGDVDAVTQLFASASVDDLARNLTKAQEKGACNRLGIPYQTASLEPDLVAGMKSWSEQRLAMSGAPHKPSQAAVHSSATAAAAAAAAAAAPVPPPKPLRLQSAAITHIVAEAGPPVPISTGNRKSKLYWSSHFDFKGTVNNLVAADYRSYLGSKLQLLRDVAVAANHERTARMLQVII